MPLFSLSSDEGPTTTRAFAGAFWSSSRNQKSQTPNVENGQIEAVLGNQKSIRYDIFVCERGGYSIWRCGFNCGQVYSCRLWYNIWFTVGRPCLYCGFWILPPSVCAAKEYNVCKYIAHITFSMCAPQYVDFFIHYFDKILTYRYPLPQSSLLIIKNTKRYKFSERRKFLARYRVRGKYHVNHELFPAAKYHPNV